jgi:hypothetical protein
MDGSRFDLLARTFGTRRAALRLLGGTTVSLALSPRDLDARPKKKRKKPCKAPKKKCGGKCIAIQTDASNCGACGNVCGSQICRAGQCLPKPVCLSNGATFRQGEGLCCSQNIACDLGPMFIECTCMPGEPGNSCLAPGDCKSGSCIDFRCA